MIRSCWGRKKPPSFEEEDAATPRLGYIPAATRSFNAQLCSHFFPFIIEGPPASYIPIPIRKRPRICARFGLGDRILSHSLINVEMTSVQRMKIFTWM